MGMVDDLVTRIVLRGTDELSAPAGAAAASLRGLGDKATETGGLVDVTFKTMAETMQSLDAKFRAWGEAGAQSSGKVSGSVEAAASTVAGAAARIDAATTAASARFDGLAGSVGVASGKIAGSMDTAASTTTGATGRMGAAMTATSAKFDGLAGSAAATGGKIGGSMDTAAGAATGASGRIGTAMTAASTEMGSFAAAASEAGLKASTSLERVGAATSAAAETVSLSDARIGESNLKAAETFKLVGDAVRGAGVGAAASTNAEKIGESATRIEASNVKAAESFKLVGAAAKKASAETSVSVDAEKASLQGLGDRATAAGSVVDAASKTMSDSVNTVSTRFDALAGSAGIAGSKVGSSLESAAGISGTAMGSIETAMTSAAASMERFAAATEAAGAKAASSLKGVSSEVTATSAKVAESDKVIEERNAKAAESFKLIGDAAVSAGVKTGEAGAMMMEGPLGLILGVGLAVGETIHMADKMETTFALIRGNTGATTDEIAKMRAETMKLGSETPAKLDDIAKGFERAANMGFKGADAMKLVSASVKAAVATGADVAGVTNTVALAMSNFHIPAKNAALAVSTLLAGAQNANTRLPDMAAHMSKLGIIASGIHMPLQDAVASFSALTRATGDAAQAQTLWTGMTTHMINVVKPAHAALVELGRVSGIDLVGAFKKFSDGAMSQHDVLALTRKALGLNSSAANKLQEDYAKLGAGTMSQTAFMKEANTVSHGQAAAIMTIFGGLRGGVGALNLMTSGWSGYNDIMKKTHAGTTALNESFKGMMDTTGAKFETFKNKVEIGAIALGSKMLPAVGAVLDGLMHLSDWVASKGGVIQGFFDKIGSVIGKVFSALMPGFTMLKNLVENDLVAAFNRFKPVIANVSTILDTIGQKATEFSKGGGKALAGVFELIGKTIGFYITVWSTMITWIYTFESAVLKGVVQSKALSDVLGKLGTALQPVFTAIQQVVGSLGLFSKSSDDGGKSATVMAGIVTNLLVGAITVLAKVIEAAVPTIVAAFRVIGDVIKVVAATIKDLVPIVQDTWKLITDIFHGNGEKVHADLEAVWGKIKKLFVDLNPIVAKLENDLWVLVQKAFSAGATVVLAGLGDFGHAFVAFIEGLPARLGQGWMDITQKGTDALGQLATAGMAKLQGFSDRMTGWLADRAGDFGNAAVAWIGGLVGGLGSQIGHLWSWYTDVTNRMAGWVADRAGDMLNAGARFVTNLVSGLVGKTGDVLGWLGSTATSITTWITTRAGDLLTAGASFATNLVTGLTSKTGDLIGWYAAQAATIMTWEKDRAADLLSAGASFVTNLVSGLTSKTSDVMGWFGSTKDKIASWISERVTQFTTAAHSWVASMVTGLGDKIQSLISEATKIATAIFDTIKTFFTSHNPFSGLVDQAKNAVGDITGFLGGIGSGISSAVGGHLGSAGGSATGGGGYTRGDQYGHYGNFSANYLSPSSGDPAMLQSLGVGYSGGLMDTDFATGSGNSQAFRLPPGGSYQLEKQGTSSDVGGYEVWRNKINGGVEMFLHALQESGHKVGDTVAGGTTVGMSGHALTTAYGNDPSFWHLCVVNDAGEREWLSGAQMTAASARGAHAGGGGALAARQRGGTWSPTPHILGGEHNLPGVRADYAFSMPRGGEHYAGGVQTDYNQAQRNQYMGGFVGTGSSTGALGALAAQSPQHKYSSFGAAQADTGNLSASIVKLTGSLDKLSPEVAKTMKAAIVAEAAQMQGYTSKYNSDYATENSRHVTAVAKIYSDNASQTVKQEGIYHAAIAANNKSAITQTAAAHEKFIKAQGKINDRFQTAQINEGTSLQTARNNADRAQTQALARLSQTEATRQANSNSALTKANTAANSKFTQDTKKENDRYKGILKDHGTATDAQLRAHTTRLKAITQTHSDKLATDLAKHPVKMAAVTGSHVTALDRITQAHTNAWQKAAHAHVTSFDKATRQHTLQMGYLTQAHVKDYGAANEKLSKANDKWLTQHKTILAGHLDSEGKGFDKHIAGLKSGLTAHLNGLSAANAALVAKMKEALTDHALWDGLAAHLSNVIGKGTKDLAYQILKGTADQTHAVRPGGMNTDGGTGNTITQVANNAPLMASLAESIRKQKAMSDAMTAATARAAAAAGDFGKSLAATTTLLAGKVSDSLNKFIYDSLHPKGGPGGLGGGTAALPKDLAKYDATYAKQQANIAKTQAAQDAANRSVGVFGTSLTSLAGQTSGPAKLAMDAFTYSVVKSTGDTKTLAATMVSTAQADKAAVERTNQAHLLADQLLGNFGTSLADSQKKVSDTYTTASDKFLYDSGQQSGATQQDISDLLASSQALKSHNASVTANIDSQNRITGSYTSSVATFTAQINGPLTDANAKYAYDLHNHTGNLEADITAIQSATQGVQALGDESRRVAEAGVGSYDAAILNAQALAASTAATYENAKQDGMTGQALADLFQKAVDAGVSLAGLQGTASGLATAITGAIGSINAGIAGINSAATSGYHGPPPGYVGGAGYAPTGQYAPTGPFGYGSPGSGGNTGVGQPGGAGLTNPANPGNAPGQAQGVPTGAMPGGASGSTGVINGQTYSNGPSVTGLPYFDKATNLFVANGGVLTMDMLNQNASMANGGGGNFNNPALPTGAYITGGNPDSYPGGTFLDKTTGITYHSNPGQTNSLNPQGFGGLDAYGRSTSASVPNMGSASGSTAPGSLSQAFLNSRLHPIRTQPIGGTSSGYVGPSSGAAGASPSNPVYVTPTSMSASQTTAMQSQLTQLQAQTAAAQAASNAQIAALQAANALQAEQLAHAIQDTLTLKELQRQNTEALNLSTHNGTAYSSTAQMMDMAALQNRGAT